MSTKTVKALWVLLSVTALMVVIAVFPVPALSLDKPADNMLLIATNMELTESEAKGFWPVYEWYQKKLTGINQRMVKLIENYAADYQAKTLTDEKAKKLTEELVAIGKAEAELQAASVPKLSKVLPPKKVARYLQIENKIRAVVKYELAKAVPLVE
jgi:hypothetical protein